MSDIFAVARTPRTLWIELTSKCPFDCIFCSRKLRRGVGQHLPFDTYQTLLDQLADPRKLILNYSGESTLYPELIPAIRYARDRGAAVELVSALATAPESMLQPLVDSGLNRLTVSLHATDPDRFAEIYRYSDFQTLRSRLERFLDLCGGIPRPPTVDLAFVAMDTNLPQFANVASFADTLELHDVSVFPVMRRDEIPVQFPTELTGAVTHRPEFERRVRDTVAAAQAEHPRLRFHIANDCFTAPETHLGEVPIPYPRELPPGALIHSCEQNPWDTAHVLANGDVVACEVLDRVPLGNILHQPMAGIWHGSTYQDFRRRYRRGQVPECRTCPWKRAYRLGPLTAEIIAARGMSAQLLHGWHAPSNEAHIWSSQEAAATLRPRPGAHLLHVSGLLPPGPNGSPNQLTITVNGAVAGTVTNPWEEIMDFGLDFAVDAEAELWSLEFRTSHIHRPSERDPGADQRDLGFAMVLLAAKHAGDPRRAAIHRDMLQPLAGLIHTVDRWGRAAARRGRRSAPRLAPWKPGITVLIPERDNPAELADCLAGLRRAACNWSEPLETVIVVNGTPKSAYRDLRAAYPEHRWRFHRHPLGFSGAVHDGLRAARHDWVYLLNNDIVLDPDALHLAATHRAGGVFAVASQIVLKDHTRFREETNWTTLLVEDGLATVHDWIPTSPSSVPGFYAGGGASLFRTGLLRRFLDRSVYHPFYWEDVEWGWRARKLGYHVCFCPGSIAHHTQHSTIGRLYRPDFVDRIVARNRQLFQLRNFTEAGSLDATLDEIARGHDPAHFLQLAVRWQILRGRLWNHFAPLADDEVFAQWNRAPSATIPS